MNQLMISLSFCSVLPLCSIIKNHTFSVPRKFSFPSIFSDKYYSQKTLHHMKVLIIQKGFFVWRKIFSSSTNLCHSYAVPQMQQNVERQPVVGVGARFSCHKNTCVGTTELMFHSQWSVGRQCIYIIH